MIFLRGSYIVGLLAIFAFGVDKLEFLSGVGRIKFIVGSMTADLFIISPSGLPYVGYSYGKFLTECTEEIGGTELRLLVVKEGLLLFVKNMPYLLAVCCIIFYGVPVDT